MYTKTLLTICLVSIVSPYAIGQPASGDPEAGDMNTRDKVVPISTTLYWTNARELSIQLDSAADRMAFADLIVANCNSNTQLSTAQRVDGYNIAANAYFMDGDHVKSASSFTKVLQIATSSLDLMNANRMLGIIEKSELDYTTALNYFKEAWDHAQLADPDGEDMMSDSVLANICWLHSTLGMYEEGINYAILGATYFQDSQSNLVDTAHYKYWQYLFNSKLGDTALAHQILTELLDSHPKYGLLDHGNLRASLLMEKHKLIGDSWDDLSAEFMDEAIAIINDDAYKFSTYRIHLVNKLSERYDSEFPNKAIEIRTTVYSRLLQDLDNAQLSDYDRGLLLSRASMLPYNNALTFYRKLGDINNAILELDTLLSQANVPSDIAGLATNLRSTLVAMSSP